MSFRPFKSSQRYLSLDLETCTQVCPDWLLVFFEVLRQQKVQGLKAGDILEMRKPIWDAAGVVTPDRRKKVMNHLERNIPNDVLEFKRRRGVVPLAIIGPKIEIFPQQIKII